MKILKIKSQLSKAGKPLVIVETAERVHFVPWGQWMQSCTQDLTAYVGGDFSAAYFQKGDTLFNGQEATDDNIIIETFAASMNPAVAAYAAVITADKKAADMNEAMLLQRRLRNERKTTPAPLVTETA